MVFGHQGEATLIAGIHIDWDGIIVHHTFGAKAVQSTNTIPEPVFSAVGPKLKIIELSESVGVYIQPHLELGMTIFNYPVGIDLAIEGALRAFLNLCPAFRY